VVVVGHEPHDAIVQEAAIPIVEDVVLRVGTSNA
jgi:hypothetical protein